MAYPSHLTDNFQNPRLHPPPSVTSANRDGTPSADAGDDGPNGESCAAPSAVGRSGGRDTMQTAEASPTPGQDDDDGLEDRPAGRSWGRWLLNAGLVVGAVAVSAAYGADTSSASTGRAHGHHSSCPQCGTPYQRGPSGLGPTYTPEPRAASSIRREQTRDIHSPALYPACYCLADTGTPLSPTGAPTRSLSSGSREYRGITGYPSSSQQNLGGTTTANANTSNTYLPHGSPAGVYYGSVTTRGTSSSGYRVSSADSERTSLATRTQPRNYVSGVYDGGTTGFYPPVNPESRRNAAYIASVPPASVYRNVATTRTSSSGYQVSLADSHTSERRSQVPHTQRNYASAYIASVPPASVYRNVATTPTSISGYQVSLADSHTSERRSQVTPTQPRNYASANIASVSPASASVYGNVSASSTGYRTDSRTSERTPRVTPTQPRNYASPLHPEYPPSANRESRHNATNIAPVSITNASIYSKPAPVSEQRATRTTTPPVTSARLPSNSVTSQRAAVDRADGADAAYSGSTNNALVSDMIIKGFIKSEAVADVMRAVDRVHYVTDKAKAYSPVWHRTEQGVAVPAPHTYAAILELILPRIKAGSHVLDVGASTGMFAAMLYHRTGEDGVTVNLALAASDKVFGIAKQNLIADGLDQALQMGRILLVKGDEKSVRYAPCAPYDVIHVTKVMDGIPPLLLTQLASPGRMIIPVRDAGRAAMIQVDKDATGKVSQKELPNLRIL